MNDNRRDDGTDWQGKDDGTEVRGPFSFETHAEANPAGANSADEDHAVVSPADEGDVTRGLKHGAWNYRQGGAGQYGPNRPPEDEGEDQGP